MYMGILWVSVASVRELPVRKVMAANRINFLFLGVDFHHPPPSSVKNLKKAHYESVNFSKIRNVEVFWVCMFGVFGFPLVLRDLL